MANSTSHAALPYPVKNARFTVLAPFLDADGDPLDPTTPDTEFSLDAGAFADTAEEVTTISGSNGVGYITLSGAETNGSVLALAFKVASGPKATLMTLYPRVLPILESGTAQAGANGTITLASGAAAYDLSGCIVRTTGGTGGGGTGGANNQARVITAYNTSTKVATVVPNWETNPSSDTTYDILLTEVAVNAVVGRFLRPTTDGRTLDVSAGGEAGVDWANVGSQTTTVGLSGTTISTSQAVASVSGAVGSVTGAVGSVTGNVGGNVTGSVGSVAAGGLTAASFAANAINASKLDPDVTTELQAGLATQTSVDDLPTNAELDARTLVAANYATAANQTTILNRLGAWTGSARNTILGALQALFRKDSDASVPSDVNADLGGGVGVANNTTDSLEAIRDRGDAAWVTGTIPTAGAIADAVWDEAIADHQGVGSTGEALSDAGGAGTPPTAAEVADAVWDEARADHATNGTFGQGAASVQGNVTGSVGSVSGAVGSVTGNVGGNVTGSVGSVAAGGITAASLAANALTAAKIDPDVTTELQAGLATAASIAALNNLSAGQVRTELATELGRIDAAVSTRASQTSVDTVDDFLDTEIAAIKAKTDNLPASPAAVGSAMTLTSGERDAIAAALLDLANGVETSVTVRQSLRAMAAVLVGTIADASTTTNTFKAIGNTGTTRVTSTLDGDENRTAVVLNL